VRLKVTADFVTVLAGIPHIPGTEFQDQPFDNIWLTMPNPNPSLNGMPMASEKRL
jgi:hypothetical protein